MAKEVGLRAASRRLGIAPNSIRRWIDPEFAARDYEANAKRRKVPCEVCGEPCLRYGRRHSELGHLCHKHLVKALADQKRGFTVEQMAEMHADGLSTNEIAHATGSTQSAVYALLIRHGYTVGPQTRGHRGGSPEHGKVDPRLVWQLKEEGLNISKIASRLGVSGASIKYHLSRPRAWASSDPGGADPDEVQRLFAEVRTAMDALTAALNDAGWAG